MFSADNLRQVPNSSLIASVPLQRKMSWRLTLREQQQAFGNHPMGESSRIHLEGGDNVKESAATILDAVRDFETENQLFVAYAESNGSGHRQSKRPRTNMIIIEIARASSNSSCSNGRSFTGKLENPIDGLILGDRGSVGYLQCHFKETDCALPLLEKMTEKEAYLDMAMENASAMEANNKYVVIVEQRMKDTAPADMRSTISKLTSEQNKDLVTVNDNSLRLTAHATYHQLSMKVLELDAEAKAKAVSDFSLGKFKMLQLSEGSVLMEINKITHAPKGLYQFGINISLVSASLGGQSLIRVGYAAEAEKDKENVGVDG
ncbi:unnamed protein product [Microthlaspi erraticum]|uniref:Uncharacterized protein n=1 Tax=Microthlaspi erraticum TaxID=1685480 RepID=A0A6D2IAM3_9BRAS|nr:unnamed protein product [Microthlaspi erraticum]